MHQTRMRTHPDELQPKRELSGGGTLGGPTTRGGYVGIDEAMAALEGTVDHVEKEFAATVQMVASLGVLRAMPESPDKAGPSTAQEPSIDAPLVQRIIQQQRTVERLAVNLGQLRASLAL